MKTQTQPVALGLEPSFGFGDRLGLATAGHLEALRQFGGPIRGIFAQQSIREMTRTNRTPQQVMTDAMKVLDDANFNDISGADADHLKTKADVDSTADAGFVFFTIDPSDDVDQKADGYDANTIEEHYKKIADRVAWISEYAGKKIDIPQGPSISFDELTVKRAAVKYGLAILKTIEMAGYINDAADRHGKTFEIELSVDETDQPTTLAEHYIIAHQLRENGVKPISLAPRFIGDLEKGVDYKGDLNALEKSLEDHAAIAAHLGPYKLSLHSGSDKLSMYSLFAKATRGCFHVKTAGTSYLEAIRVVARHNEKLFRNIIEFSRNRYDTDKATYHVSATLADVPPASEVSDVAQLEQLYLECWSDVPEGKGFTNPGRQILHCTFGSVLTDPTFGPAVKQTLIDHADTYVEVLTDHFGRHLRALCAGM